MAFTTSPVENEELSGIGESVWQGLNSDFVQRMTKQQKFVVFYLVDTCHEQHQAFVVRCPDRIDDLAAAISPVLAATG